jgi:Ca2+-binding RTX toxin-like protein
VFGGLGNDSIRMSGIGGSDTLQGNEGNDTLFGYAGIDTVSGGSGADVFVYSVPADDGQNAASGGPIELLTDLNWAEDRIQTLNPVTFTTDVGARPGTTLIGAANNAIAAAFTLSGSHNLRVAAQFTFGGHAYLAINLDTALNSFEDYGDLLIDVTGVTGTITMSNFL